MTTPLIETIARAIADGLKSNAVYVSDDLRKCIVDGGLFDLHDLAAPIITALTEAGYAIVPIESTEEMLQGACEKHRPGRPMSDTTPSWRGPEWDTDEECPSFVKRRRIYRAMIEAGRASYNGA